MFWQILSKYGLLVLSITIFGFLGFMLYYFIKYYGINIERLVAGRLDLGIIQIIKYIQ